MVRTPVTTVANIDSSSIQLRPNPTSIPLSSHSPPQVTRQLFAFPFSATIAVQLCQHSSSDWRWAVTTRDGGASFAESSVDTDQRPAGGCCDVHP